MGFTFWGEAVALVLGFVAAERSAFAMRNLRASAPAGLLKSRGTLKHGRSLAPMLVRRIHSPVTPAVLDFLDWVAGREGVSRAAAAALILHRHSGAVAHRIGAR